MIKTLCAAQWVPGCVQAVKFVSTTVLSVLDCARWAGVRGGVCIQPCVSACGSTGIHTSPDACPDTCPDTCIDNSAGGCLENRVQRYAVARMFLCLSVIAIAIAATVPRANAAPTGITNRALIHSGGSTQRYCIRHRHGDYWHSCSDMRHPVHDQSHSHTGLPTYYTSAARHRSSGFYFGVKSGSMDIDLEASDSGLPKGVVVGFGRGEFALEFEASSTSVSAASSAPFSRLDRPRFDSSYSTRAVYGVRRIGEVFYTKMKVGLSQSQYTMDGVSYKDNNGSAGVGLGLRYGTILLESEYTFVGSKARFFSISASIVF